MQKKIMILGGNIAQQTVTSAARELGHYVISVDYLPNNPAHKFADEYHNVSTIDKKAVLDLAKKLNIDGILTFASDISVPTVAFVADKLNLPTNPIKAIETLTHKNLFRSFLKENGFNCPIGKSFNQTQKQQALDFTKKLGKTCIIKPIDSSGSKGVHKINDIKDFDVFWKDALSYSICKNVIVEEFIERASHQTDGDGFVVDGKIKVFGMMDQHQDKKCSLYTPVAHSFPSVQSKESLDIAKNLAQKVFDLLNFKFGSFNYEYITDKNGKVYILEIGPRAGGNMICDAYKVSTGTDMAKCAVQCALGLDCSEYIKEDFKTCAASYVLHASKDGIFNEIKFSNEIKSKLKELRLGVKKGDKVYKFKNAKDGIGMAVFEFDNTEQMNYMIENIDKYVKILVD